MTIKDGLKLEPVFDIPLHGRRGVEIPDVGRDDFAKFLYDYGYRVGVEVGVDLGDFGKTLCQAGLKVYGVDPYVVYGEYKPPSTDSAVLYEQALENVRGYDYTIIKKFSREALKDFEDNSLDFVYIDGNHTLPYISQDIFGWERKVRRGGIISGHDYAVVKGIRERQEPKVYDGVHVKFAVDAFVYIARIPRLYILGKRRKKEGVKRDKWRSWFFFKQ
ncbi:MAG: hypothetical protein A3C30_03105 [Candidatus Levybacteria bacterium RIFCSPHIGHO2_02_FULL_40_18]|nr:MAG: hypothetical protein A2869_04855 [Candidatus Levybacteria bacterium RIFCSPHIGHO2_01_FULL_40_58]OGH26541.1 MAG: hypothetical protein A3C30_03105 [Candidatus Levybacteria bacterium RIFCSPHIGHO2_02_FULL_40_18]OGH31530.1 MAG: hypothetical protein A3E43_02195 [Candidatus Levybacteria bacterium RIFCSPHIGHO2_12_FULL_40_31]OGH40295.1 MAG: hypothetical protein A2894_00745 [Candidatus Levybacteria bacterium RIFCSPLOWO2_01_FULL_40_64]OGH49499.1 MAG: hypothetical protein A3I54_03155 [Candidatus Lev